MAFLQLSSDFIVVGLKDSIEVFSRSGDEKHFSYNHKFCEENFNTDKTVDFMQFSPSSRHFAALFSDKTLVVWSIENNGDPPWKKVGAQTVNRRSTSLCFDPDEDLIYVADKSGDVCSFAFDEFSKPPDGTVEPILGHVSILLDVAVTKKYIISADRDEKIRVSKRNLPHVIQSFCLGHREFVCKVLPLDNERLISTSGDGSIRMWDMENGKLLTSFDVVSDDKEKINHEIMEASNGRKRDRLVPSLLAYSASAQLVAVGCVQPTKGWIQLFNIETSEDKPMKGLSTVTLSDDVAVLGLVFDSSQDDKPASLYVLSQCGNEVKILCFSCSGLKQDVVESHELKFINTILSKITVPDVSVAFYAQLFKNTIPGNTYEAFYEKKKTMFKKQSNSGKKPKLQVQQ